jgi:hypothetical protein
MVSFNFVALVVIAAWYFEPIPMATAPSAFDVDHTGIPSIVYVDDDYLLYAQRVAQGDSFIWSAELIDSGMIGYCDMAIDKKSRPHILYSHNYQPSSSLWVYTYKDTLNTWHVDSLDYGGPALDTDTLDFPHTCYHNYLNDTLYHTFWDGSEWITEAIEYRFPEWVSLTIDRNNHPHIALVPAILDLRQGYVAYGTKDTSGWHTESVENYDVRDPVDIRVDSTCIPHLAYVACFDPTPHYAKKTGTWDIDIITLGSDFAVIAMEGLMPHLLIWNNGVRHIWEEGTNWQYEDIHTGWPDALGIDDENYLHCIIIDNTEVIYGTTRPQAVHEQGHSTLRSSQCATISRLPLHISFPDAKSPEEVRIFDITGRFVNSLSPAYNALELTWNGLDQHNNRVRAGMYFLVFYRKEKATIEKFIIID